MDSYNKSLDDLLMQSIQNPNTQVTIGNLQTFIRALQANSSGDVVGPASSTDNAVVRWDGATGKLTQNSVVTVSDLGTVNIPAGQTYNINGVPLGGGSGDVVGGATSTDGEIARYNLATGKIIKASATPVIVSDLGDVTLPAARTVFAATFRSISSANTSLLADSGGEVIINDSGNNAANAIGIDTSGTGGYFKFKDGAAAGVAFGNSATNGVIFGTNTVSIVTNGVEKWMVNSSGSLNPIIDNTYDIGNGTVNPRDITVSRDLITGSVKEKTAGVGVNVTGTAGNLILMQGVINEAYIKVPASTSDHACINLTPGGDPTVHNEGDIHYDSGTNGFHFEGSGTLRTILVGGDNSLGTPIIIMRDTGWTIHTGTGAKTAFDADWTQSISAVPTQAEIEAVRDQVIVIQKRLAGMQDHLFTNMNLLAT